VKARITFFHACAGFEQFLGGADAFAITPRMVAQASAARAREILAKAEAAARTAGVPCESVSRHSEAPHEAIVALAVERQCDLIFMASHAKGGLGGILGSQTHKVLAHSPVPVLVATTPINAPKLNQALAIIQDEHRCLIVVIRALLLIINKARTEAALPRFELIKKILHYIEQFPQTLHHPKEELYLFRRLRERSAEVDAVLDDLERQHEEGAAMLRDMQLALPAYITGSVDGLERFAQAVDRFAQAQWQHIRVEENTVLPAARKYLSEDDWDNLAAAFGKNGDPRFGGEIDAQLHAEFSSILNVAA
jgi:hemerythrin-like domain-containing protein/nucleotide-binding universal stress UspA family protein